MDNISRLEIFCGERSIPYRRDEPLKDHCTFKMGGPADLVIWPEEDSLEELLPFLREGRTRWMILGKGSNVLFADGGYRGAVICLGDAFAGIQREGDTLKAQAGATLTRLCRRALEEGLSGLEFAYGIPGSVGGAVYMNAGAYGGEMKDVLACAHHLTPEGRPGAFAGEELDLGYRRSAYAGSDLVVTRAEVRLVPGDKARIRATMEDYMGRRRAKQPLEHPSAGSAFKRPPGAFASALIDQCGLRGRRMGGASVSDKHAGFIVSDGTASCADVLALMELVRETVYRKTGHNLEGEIRVIPE